jgi:voltage-gated potassium channel Kch
VVAQVMREPLPARAVTVFRLFFVVLGVASMILGYIGLEHYVHVEQLAHLRPPGDDSAGNLIYYDIELFLVQSTPLAGGGPMPWQVQIARFAAPAVLPYAFAEILVAVFATRIRRARIGRSRGHAIVCGSTRAAQVLARRLRADGMRVVVVTPEEASGSVDRDTLVADPRSSASLLAAGAARAASLYACLELSEENAQTAAAAEQIQHSRGHPCDIHVLINDLNLCASLRARRWSLVEAANRHVDFFNLDELAGLVTARTDAPPSDVVTPEIAIVGTGAFARSVLLESARQWISHGGAEQGPLLAILVGADAAAVASELFGRYAFLEKICRIEPRTEPFDRVLIERREDPTAYPLRRLYLCQGNESEAFKSALDAAAYLQSTYLEVVVRLDRMVGLAGGFRPDRDGSVLFDALGGRLRLVDVSAEGCDPGLINDGMTEELARACHQSYLTRRLSDGEALDSAPAMVQWEQLVEEYRAANRDQARGVGRRLAAIGCLLSPRRADGPQLDLQPEELEYLAELEHDRWNEERSRSGWTWGAVRDETAKLHPSLLPWSVLPEPEREKDREAVQAMTPILADVGLMAIRSRPLGGRSEVRRQLPGVAADAPGGGDLDHAGDQQPDAAEDGQQVDRAERRGEHDHAGEHAHDAGEQLPAAGRHGGVRGGGGDLRDAAEQPGDADPHGQQQDRLEGAAEAEKAEQDRERAADEGEHPQRGVQVRAERGDQLHDAADQQVDAEQRADDGERRVRPDERHDAEQHRGHADQQHRLPGVARQLLQGTGEAGNAGA